MRVSAWGFQRPLTLILLQKHRDTIWSRIVIQIGGVCTTFCQEEGILLQKYRDRNGRCIEILSKNIAVRGRFGSPDLRPTAFRTSAFGNCRIIDQRRRPLRSLAPAVSQWASQRLRPS